MTDLIGQEIQIGDSVIAVLKKAMVICNVVSVGKKMVRVTDGTQKMIQPRSKFDHETKKFIDMKPLEGKLVASNQLIKISDDLDVQITLYMLKSKKKEDQ